MHTTEDLIQLALKEDIGSGDITTDNLVAPDVRGKGIIVAKQDLVVAGLDVAEKVFKALEPRIDFAARYTDGDRVAAREHAQQAKNYAFCDGPPYSYKVAYDEAEQLLQAALGGEPLAVRRKSSCS